MWLSTATNSGDPRVSSTVFNSAIGKWNTYGVLPKLFGLVPVFPDWRRSLSAIAMALAFLFFSFFFYEKDFTLWSDFLEHAFQGCRWGPKWLKVYLHIGTIRMFHEPLSREFISTINYTIVIEKLKQEANSLGHDEGTMLYRHTGQLGPEGRRIDLWDRHREKGCKLSPADHPRFERDDPRFRYTIYSMTSWL